MAKFKKGESGNPAGKPKGALNKTTKEMKEILNKALFGDAQSIIDDLALLEPKDRLMIKAKFAPFILPSMKAVEAKVITEGDTSLGFNINYNTGDLKKDNE
tara:strand:+ start:4033 stop:4335 length:303 start_codon:yes stop_codon:yes gene_type:complete